MNRQTSPIKLEPLTKSTLKEINGGGDTWKWLGKIVGETWNFLKSAGEFHVEEMQKPLPYNGY